MEDLNTTQRHAQGLAITEMAVAVEWHQGLGGSSVVAINDDATNENAAKVLRLVKARMKALEAQRVAITKPLNDALRAVNDLFRPPREKFEDIEKMLKDGISDYLRRKQEKNDQAIQTAAVAPTAPQAQLALSELRPIEVPKGISTREVWKAEVVDPDAVPREYCSPDPKKIKAYLDSLRGDPSMAGVRFTKESIVAARAG